MSDPEPEKGTTDTDVSTPSGVTHPAEAASVEPANAPQSSPPLSVDEPSGDAIFDTLWARTQEGWDNEKTHVVVFDYAYKNQLLPELAKRYQALRDDPERGTLAKKKVEGLTLALLAILDETRTQRRAGIPLPITLSAVGMALAAVMFLLYVMYRIR